MPYRAKRAVSYTHLDVYKRQVAALVTAERPEWRGTATELVAALGLDMKPNGPKY